jgi:GNAT superfamily N-acetyltransferase
MPDLRDESAGEDEDEDEEYGDSYDDYLGRGFDIDEDEIEDEEYKEKEYEVEERLHTLQSTPPCEVKVKLVVLKDGELAEFQSWLQTIHVTCTLNGKNVGSALSRYIIRDRIRANFWRDMEEPCHEMSELAFDLFDRYGYLKDELKNHPVRKGSGVWGEELNKGNLLLIEYIQIDKQWRRQGLGRFVISAMIDKAEKRGTGIGFALLCPGWLNYVVDKEEGDLKTKREKSDARDRHQVIAETFYRSLAFRRVGASSWFALATDKSHKAYNLLPQADYNPQYEDDEESDDDEDNPSDPSLFFEDRQEYRKLKKMQEKSPLFHAATALPDDECLPLFKSFLTSNPTPGIEWRKIDRSYDNLLHIAACRGKPKCVQWLIQNIDKDKSLRGARNVKGYTPLEAAQSLAESTRVSMNHGMATICISDKFRGFPTTVVDCISHLKGLQNPSAIEIARIKYGCTCGQCIGGFISPRMKFALLAHSEMTHDELDMFVDDGPLMWFGQDCLFEHVAPATKENFRTNKSLREGFRNLFDHIASCLRKNIIPTTQNILQVWRDSSEWPPVTKNYLERGGTPASALSAVFDCAVAKDENTGDGEFMELFRDDIEKLPKCRNDGEFGFVALQCGLPPRHPYETRGGSLEENGSLEGLLTALRRGRMLEIGSAL